jgi:hypothetical protein
VSYWLTLSGTSERPLADERWLGGAGWRTRYGNVKMFSRRPTIDAGDRLVAYAEGSARLFGEPKFFTIAHAALRCRTERTRQMVMQAVPIRGRWA